MSVRLWNTAKAEDPLLRIWGHHTEFAVGIDWDVLTAGQIASCGWDALIFTWPHQGQPTP